VRKIKRPDALLATESAIAMGTGRLLGCLAARLVPEKQRAAPPQSLSDNGAPCVLATVGRASRRASAGQEEQSCRQE